MSKRIDDKAFNKFVRDVKSLRSIYTDARIAAIMKTNPGNFSSRVNGVKRPGQDFIDRFYQVFGKKLKEMAETESEFATITGPLHTIKGPLQLNEPKQDFPSPANTQDERLQRIEESISRLTSTVATLMDRLVISHQKLIDAHLSMLSQRPERAGNMPAEP